MVVVVGLDEKVAVMQYEHRNVLVSAVRSVTSKTKET